MIDRFDDAGGAVVVKDYAPRPWPIRLLLGPWHLDREERAYALLRGAPGIPGFLGRVDRQAIALHHVAGRPLAACARGEIDAAFFDALERILEDLHTRGVAHGDLHRHDVIRGEDGRPYVVDFSTALAAGRAPDPLLAWLFRQMCRADLRAAAKLRRGFLPGEDRPVPDRGFLHALGSRLRRLLDRLRGEPR